MQNLNQNQPQASSPQNNQTPPMSTGEVVVRAANMAVVTLALIGFGITVFVVKR